MRHIIYKPGDVLFFRNTGWLQRIVSLVSGRQLDWDRPEYKRLAIVTVGGDLASARAVEARAWGFRESDLARHEGREAVCYRPADSGGGVFLALAARQVAASCKYPLPSLIRQVADAVCSDRQWFRRVSMDALLLCRSLIGTLRPVDTPLSTVLQVHSELFWSKRWEMRHPQVRLEIEDEW